MEPIKITMPKVIYFCWFGNNPIPELTRRCIDSWKKYCPGYEVHQIDESNFDVNECDYVREAYESGKWAFVSDYARMKVLEQHGGLYFDTDVELVAPIDDIVSNGSFFACEYIYSFKNDSTLPHSTKNRKGVALAVNPGLAMGAEANHEIFKEVLRGYECDHYLLSNGRENQRTIVLRVTEVLERHGFNKHEFGIQAIEGITVYPPQYFAGYNDLLGRDERSENTRAVHHYSASWTSPIGSIKNGIRRKFVARGRIVYCIGYFITAPLALIDRVGRRIRNRK